MTAELLSTIDIDPDGPPRASVIWLHGLGADGSDFVPIVPELGLDPTLGVRFVFPHAPRIPVTVNFGMVMRAWYDIASLGPEGEHDLEGLRRSAEAVRLLVEREIERGIPSHRLVLAGFSQGGAVALHLGPRYPRPLAGILALSTYLATGESLEEERAAANAEVRIFQGHGTMDPMVPVSMGEAARDRLRDLGYPVEWRTYPIPHAVSPEEIGDIGNWLGKVLGENG
jgi:phospholipase/carboxylesterase